MARVDIVIEAQNRAQQPLNQVRQQLLGVNNAAALPRVRVAADNISVFRDRLGRLHEASGRHISQQKALAQGYTIIDTNARSAGAGLGGVNDQLRRGSAPARRYGAEIGNIHVQLIALGVAQRAVQQAIRATFIEQSKEAINLERLQVSLRIISGSYEEATKQRERLIEVARLPGINFEQALRASLQLQAIGKDGQEATDIIKEFGNAFALAGGTGQQLFGVVHGIRQIISDGTVLQRELNIITSRIAVLTPIMQEAFGGNRAEDVRAFAESIGRGDEIVEVFFEKIIAGLKELPRAGNTAGNAIENLQDSIDRAQAQVGGNFLPLIKELTSGFEGFANTIEDNPGLAKGIAQLEVFVGILGSVAIGIGGVGVAAKILGPGIIAAFSNPFGAAALAAGALAAGLLTVQVRASQLRAEIEKTGKAVERVKSILEAPTLETLTAALDQISERQRTVRADIERLSANGLTEIRPGRFANENQAEIEGLQASLAETLPIVEQLSRALGQLDTDAQQTASRTQASLENLIDNLGASATSSTQAIAIALQHLDDFGGGRDTNLNDENRRARDLALDLGDQLIAIAESTSVKQIESNKKRVDTLARDNSLIIDDNEQLQSLLLAAEEAFTAQRRQLRQQEIADIQSANRGVAASQRLQAETDFSREFRDIRKDLLEATNRDEVDAAQTRINTALEALDRLGIRHQAFNRYLVDLARIRERTITEIEQDERDRAIQGYYSQRIEAEMQFSGQFRDIRSRLLEATRQGQVDALQKEFDATVQNLTERGIAYQAFNRFIQQFPRDRANQEEQILDEQLSHLADTVEARQAQHEDDLRSQRQVEEQKQKKYEETHDYETFLLGLRNKSVKEATQALARLEERALDASSSRQFENLIRETNQFVEAYAERGEAFRGLVADAQDLGAELQQAFDLTEQQRRLEDFHDSLVGVIEDVASIALDHLFDGFFGTADDAASAIGIFTDVFRGDIELLENDVTRLTRQVEDSRIRLSRINEDESRSIRQLERQRRSLLARASTGNQRDAERTRQRAQDISFRIANLRENFDVRRQRSTEDADLRRNSGIEDALQRLQRSQAEQPSLIGDIGQTLETAMKNALAAQLSGYLTKTAFDTGVSLITAGLGALGIGDLVSGIAGLFGGGDGEGEGDGTGDADLDGTIKTLTVDPDLATVTVDVTGLIKSAAQAAEGQYTIPILDAGGRITSAEVSEGARLPSIPNLKGGISNVVLQMNASLPLVPGLAGEISTLSIKETLEAQISKIAFAEDIDAPNLPQQELTIASVAFAEGVAAPALGAYEALINSIQFAQGVSPPSLDAYDAVIDSITFSEDIDYPSLPGFEALITSVRLASGVALPNLTPQAAAAEDPQNPPSTSVDLIGRIASAILDPDIDIPTVTGLAGTIESVILANDVDLPTIRIAATAVAATALTGLTGTIEDVLISPDIDTPTITGLDGRIDSVSLDPDADLPTIRIAATAVVSGVGGVDGQRLRDADEDPENPPLDSGLEGTIGSLSIDPAAREAIEPVVLSASLKPTLDLSMIDQPIRLTGIIEAQIQYFTGAGGGGGGNQGNQGGGGGDNDEPTQRSQIATDISRIADVFEGATISGNLNPARGDTPRVDIPTPDLDIDNVPVPSRALPGSVEDIVAKGGFGNALRDANQFRPGVGAGHVGGAGTLRVALPTETLSRLAQQATLLKQFTSANQHLAIIRTFLANHADFATETTLLGIAETLNQVQLATERIADAPLVQGLVDAGVGFTSDPTDPTNAALTQSPFFDILSQGGLGDFSTLHRIAEMAEGTPPLLGGADNPGFVSISNFPEIQKVEVTNKVQTETEITNDVNVKHVGVVQVSQSGEFVVRLAGGGTLPVEVRGGRMVVDIGGGLESLAIELDEVEVGLRDLGALIRG